MAELDSGYRAYKDSFAADTCEVQSGPHRYSVNFHKMQQINLTARRQRTRAVRIHTHKQNMFPHLHNTRAEHTYVSSTRSGCG